LVKTKTKIKGGKVTLKNAEILVKIFPNLNAIGQRTSENVEFGSPQIQLFVFANITWLGL
jgi:hypothetical protein